MRWHHYLKLMATTCCFEVFLFLQSVHWSWGSAHKAVDKFLCGHQGNALENSSFPAAHEAYRWSLQRQSLSVWPFQTVRDKWREIGLISQLPKNRTPNFSKPDGSISPLPYWASCLITKFRFQQFHREYLQTSS